MTLSSIQNSFIGGEISPSLFGRTDLAKYHSGASTMRNFFANYRGGASSRAGTAYVGMMKQGAPNSGGTDTFNQPRLITFQFNINQGYALEFGDEYMRIISNGAYVVEDPENITGATKANPCEITIVAHDYVVGDWLYIAGMGGMTNFNGLIWVVNDVVDVNTIVLEDLFGNVVNSSVFSVYTSGGTASRIYTVVSPYAAEDLPYLKFTQSADTMSLTCVNQDTLTEYPPYELTRNGATDWVFTQTDFGTSITPPTNVTSTAQSSTTLSTWYGYVVTAVDAITGEESVSSATTSVQNNDIAVNAGSNTVSWTAVTGAGSYNVYKATPSYSVDVPIGSQYGFAGTAFGTSFTDNNITADFTTTPPKHNDPFARGTITAVTITGAGAGYSQSTASYSITTSTGSGFAGTPIVLSGGIVGFIIENGGADYQPTDTITITGGTGAVKATGTYTFTGNPTNGQNIVLNGVTWTFVTSGAGVAQTNIGGSLLATLNQLSSDLNVSSNVNILVATYTNNTTVLTITYDSPGTGGNAYTLAAGTYGGTVSGAHLTGGINGATATATMTVGPETGTYPGVVSYFQQRRGYANTINKPNTYFFSQPGAFTNMDSSIPVTDSDAIVGAPWAQQVNGIQFMQPMQSTMIILTGNGAWSLTGGGQNTTLTPSAQNATSQAYNGSSTTVPPIVVNFNILYVQSKGSIIRDLAYNFFVNIFTGTDVTVLSNHLFNYHQVREWAYTEEPYKLVWVVRDDGVLLSLTYLKEQDVYAWAHHDTNGFYVSVCSVTEPPVDALYTAVKRYVNGQWVYYAERMDNRNWQNAEDCFCVDAGLTTPMTYPDAVLTPAAAEGNRNISEVNIILGGSGYTAPMVRAVDPTGQGTGATFTAILTGNVITSITVDTEGEDYQSGTILEITDSTGSGAKAQAIITNNVVFTTDANAFTADNVGDVIRIGNNNYGTLNSGLTTSGGGQAVITSYVSATEVIADITQQITATIPNNPDNMPIPAISGQWSLATPTATVSGLNHLDGLDVAILADGSVVPNQTVVNGSITLPHPYSRITVGLPFICQLQTLYLDPQNSNETVQGKRKNITSVVTRFENSRGMSVGTNQPDQSTQINNALIPWTNMSEIKDRNALITAGSAIPLFTGDHYKNVDSAWSEYGQVAIQQTFPLACNCLAVVSEYRVGDTPSP